MRADEETAPRFDPGGSQLDWADCRAELQMLRMQQVGPCNREFYGGNDRAAQSTMLRFMTCAHRGVADGRTADYLSLSQINVRAVFLPLAGSLEACVTRVRWPASNL